MNEISTRRPSESWSGWSVMCRYKGDGGEAVAYLDLQIPLESRKPLGWSNWELLGFKGFLTYLVDFICSFCVCDIIQSVTVY